MTLLSHSRETAARIADSRQNELRVPGIELPPRIEVTAEAKDLESATDLVIVAVPSAHVRSTVERWSQVMGSQTPRTPRC